MDYKQMIVNGFISAICKAIVLVIIVYIMGWYPSLQTMIIAS